MRITHLELSVFRRRELWYNPVLSFKNRLAQLNSLAYQLADEKSPFGVDIAAGNISQGKYKASQE